MDISETFDKACAHLPSLTGKLSDDELLYFYARFKLVTIGPCNTNKPGIFDFQGRKKWNAWKDLGNMDEVQAKEEYITKLGECDSSWQSKTDKLSITGPAVSRLVYDCDDSKDPDENELFDICKKGDINEFMRTFDNNLTIHDSDQRTLLHWACDRGHCEIVKFLIEKNCDVNAKDIDLSTPLHYASLCGYKNIVKILLENGADPNLADNDGEKPVDCADSTEIRTLLEARANAMEETDSEFMHRRITLLSVTGASRV